MKKSRRKRITAEALLKQLHADPEWVAAREQEDRIRAERAAQLRAAEAPVILALRDVGVEVDSVWDLVNTSRPYPEAIAVLVDQVRKPYPDKVSEGIGRALAVPEARDYWQV